MASDFRSTIESLITNHSLEEPERIFCHDHRSRGDDVPFRLFLRFNLYDAYV